MLVISPAPDVKMDDTPVTSEFKPDEGELSLLQAKHYGTADKYTEALWYLIFLADADALEKLQTIYPSHIAAYINYKRVPGWFDNLISRMPQSRRASDEG